MVTAQELQAAAERARQRQTALLAAVAEELRNPMAPIRIATTMLGFPPTDDPLLPRMRHIVERQLTRMARLVGNLVDAVNLDTGGLHLERSVVDMAQVIDRAVAANRPMMVERGQQFESHQPPGALEVQGDAARLEQIVSNLLDNASKFTHHEGRISLSVVVTGDTLTLTVSDNGIDISPKMLPHLFEPFVQDTQALGLDAVGLGIGLTVARALAQAHGGSIVAHSAGTSGSMCRRRRRSRPEGSARSSARAVAGDGAGHPRAGKRPDGAVPGRSLDIASRLTAGAARLLC